MKNVEQRDYSKPVGRELSMKLYAVLQVAHNWRIRTRLPRITKLAVKMGLI
jgi:hypothetical protein